MWVPSLPDMVTLIAYMGRLSEVYCLLQAFGLWTQAWASRDKIVQVALSLAFFREWEG